MKKITTFITTFSIVLTVLNFTHAQENKTAEPTYIRLESNAFYDGETIPKGTIVGMIATEGKVLNGSYKGFTITGHNIREIHFSPNYVHKIVAPKNSGLR